MKPALRLLATLVLLLPLSVSAKAQVSLFGFNWSMTPLEAFDTLDRGFKAEMLEWAVNDFGQQIAPLINQVEELIVDCQDDFETMRDTLMSEGIELESCELKQIGGAYIQMLSQFASSSDDSAPEAAKSVLPIFSAALERYISGESIESILASEEIFEASAHAFESIISTEANTNVWFSDGEELLSTPPLGAGFVPFLWACASERDYEWALNYKGLEGRFCGEGEDRIKYNNDLRDLEWISNEFSEPWIAFNCTKFDGCEQDDIYLADEVFERPDIKDQLEAVGQRYENHDFGLCRRAISGERLCVLNGHVIMFKGDYQ